MMLPTAAAPALVPATTSPSLKSRSRIDSLNLVPAIRQLVAAGEEDGARPLDGFQVPILIHLGAAGYWGVEHLRHPDLLEGAMVTACRGFRLRGWRRADEDPCLLAPRDLYQVRENTQILLLRIFGAADE
jgi:hypothetical protein